MFQLSKIIKSRNEWKEKAKKRSLELWESRKVHKYYKEQVSKLREENKKLKEELSKNSQNDRIKKNDFLLEKENIRVLLILLFIEGVISYRSTIRVLKIFQKQTQIDIQWIPHFTSVINWTQRIGVGLLNKVDKINKNWVAIMDHSIDIGKKQLLVILRVEEDIFLQKHGAITLKDCECVGIKISDKVTGENLYKELKEIFKKSGEPKIIVKDGGIVLKNGVNLYNERENSNIEIVDDISHVVANALKKQYAKSKSYEKYMKMLRTGATKLRQSDLSFLIPPKLRRKGRFQAISKLNNWSKKIIQKGIFSKRGKAKKGSFLARLRISFPKFKLIEPFVKNFEKTTTITNTIMKILKNRGLNISTYNQSLKLLTKLPKNSKTRKVISVWLDKHLKIQQKISPAPLISSSDIIESLFGKFKYILDRTPQLDMNSATSLVPLLCGDLDKEKISIALANTDNNLLKFWKDKNITYTVKKQRIEFFNSSQKMEINKAT